MSYSLDFCFVSNASGRTEVIESATGLLRDSWFVRDGLKTGFLCLLRSNRRSRESRNKSSGCAIGIAEGSIGEPLVGAGSKDSISIAWENIAALHLR